MTVFGSRALARAAVLAIAVSAFSSGASAQQILTAVQSERDGGDSGDLTDRQVTALAGQALAATLNGADARAVTDFGINKIYVSGTADTKAYATSAWLDSYTVGGAAGTMVDLTFTINVHGAATGIGSLAEHAYNFNFYALRGDNWSLSGQDYDGEYTGPQPYGYSPAGQGYERLTLTQTRADGSVSQMDARDFEGLNHYAPGTDGVGDFAFHTTYDAASDTYTRAFFSNGNWVEQRFSATHFEQWSNGFMQFRIPHTPATAQGRASFEANYSMLGMAQFCTFPSNECGDLVTNPQGLDLKLSFSLAAGSTFSLAGYLFADDFYEGTADFYHTVKMTGVDVSSGGTLTSASGTLVDRGGGNYGYRAVINATGAVPEPSTWALLILGFGLVGGAMRRRSGEVALAA